MNEIKVYILLTIGFTMIAIGLNILANSTIESKCIAKGGTFYSSINADHSLCKLSK